MSSRTPSGLHPQWRHREIWLSVGEGKYRFRTLSLYDVWSLWPHIKPLHDSVIRGKPMALAQHLSEALEQICPGITKSEDFQKRWTSAHLDTLIEFYEQQDWGRIKSLTDSMNEGAGDKVGMVEDMAGDQRFFSICIAAARSAGMSVVDFVEQRFEFCADAFMALWATVKEDRTADSMTGDQFAMLMATMLPQEVVGAKGSRPAPPWVEELNRVQ